MARLPTLCVSRLHASLCAVRHRLTEDARIAIDSELANIGEDALALVFTELSVSSILIFLGDGAYQLPTERRGHPIATRISPPRWLAYATRAGSRVKVDSLVHSAAGPTAAEGPPHSLAETLMRFNFLRGLEPILPKIAAVDADLGAKLKELQGLGKAFGEELDGYKINLDHTLAISLESDGAVKLELGHHENSLYPRIQALPTARGRLPYERTGVLLGRDLEITSCILFQPAVGR